MQCVYNDSKVLMFGGEITHLVEYNCDTWIFDLNGGEPYGNFTSVENDTGGGSDFLSIAWTSELPDGTSIGLQVRAGKNITDLQSKNFTGPDGNSSLFYNVSGSPLWSGLSPNSWIQYRAQLHSAVSQVTPVLKDVTIRYNRLPEIPALSDPADGLLGSNTTPTFKWNFSDVDSSGQMSFVWQLSNMQDFGKIENESGEIFSGLTEYRHPVPLADGNWYWRVAVNDTDGGWSDFSPPRSIRIDTSPPKAFTPSAYPASWTNNRSPQISFSAWDVIGGIDHYELRIDDGQYATVESPYTLPLQSDGIHNITVKAVDVLGFETTGYVNIYIDASPPNPFNITFETEGWTNNRQPTISFGTTDDLSGMDHCSVSIGARDFGPQASPFTLPALPDGIFLIKVSVFDKAGNSREANATIRIDATPPGTVQINASPASWSNIDTPTISFKSEDLTSGIANYSMMIDGLSMGNVTSPVTVSAQAEGIHEIAIIATDTQVCHLLPLKHDGYSI